MRNRSLVLLGVMVIAFAAACQGAQQGGKPAKLTVAALQGDESLGLKAIASSCGTQIGTTIEFVDNPYDALYEKLVTTFQANDATFDLVMIDDPWMPKFGTDGSLPGPRPVRHHAAIPTSRRSSGTSAPGRPRTEPCRRARRASRPSCSA